MWRITPEGRRFLRQLAARLGGRSFFAVEADIGKNQVKPLLDKPDHAISQKTIQKINEIAPDFKEGIHYVPQANADRCEIHLARDRSPQHPLSRRDQRGIITLYEALLANPDFKDVLPSFDSASEFRQWFKTWGSVDEDMPAEQFFVYRLYGETIIAFLCGERHFKTTSNRLELFAIWYLVGTANAFYDGSPLDLGSAANDHLPLGERQAATSLMVHLLEELRQENTVDYLFFEIDAAELAKPESHGRLLLRIYARAEAEVRAHFALDPLWKHCQCFVLDFPYQMPHWDEQSATFTHQEHRLVCCPMRPALRKWFQSGAVPQAVATALLKAVYEMYWDYFDADAPARAAIQQFASAAIQSFEADCAARGGNIPCFTLRDYVAKYRKTSLSKEQTAA